MVRWGGLKMANEIATIEDFQFHYGAMGGAW